MGMMNNSLSYWQAESEGIDLLDLTMGVIWRLMPT